MKQASARGARPGHGRGLTLFELMITLAVLALLATLTLPSFAGMAQRARLKSVAETLAADMTEARFESAQRGQALHLAFKPGANWCWAVATAAQCACEPMPAAACRLKAVRGADHGNIALLQSTTVRLEPSGEASASPDLALFESPSGERLRVSVSPLGRATICAPAAPVPGYRAC